MVSTITLRYFYFLAHWIALQSAAVTEVATLKAELAEARASSMVLDEDAAKIREGTCQQRIRRR